MSRYLIKHVEAPSPRFFGSWHIVDTEAPIVIGGEHLRDNATGELRYEKVCECFTRRWAETTCNALNAGATVRFFHDEIAITHPDTSACAEKPE